MIISAAVLCLHVGAGWCTLQYPGSVSTDYSITTSASPRWAPKHSSFPLQLHHLSLCIMARRTKVQPLCIHPLSPTRCPDYQRSFAQPASSASPLTPPNSLLPLAILQSSFPPSTSWSANTFTPSNPSQVSLSPHSWLGLPECFRMVNNTKHRSRIRSKFLYHHTEYNNLGQKFGHLIC